MKPQYYKQKCLGNSCNTLIYNFKYRSNIDRDVFRLKKYMDECLMWFNKKHSIFISKQKIYM